LQHKTGNLLARSSTGLYKDARKTCLPWMLQAFPFKTLQDKSLSDGIFFLELLSAVQPRAVNWSLVTKGVTGKLSSNCMLLKFFK
jgi:hypothetical protein